MKSDAAPVGCFIPEIAADMERLVVYHLGETCSLAWNY